MKIDIYKIVAAPGSVVSIIYGRNGLIKSTPVIHPEHGAPKINHFACIKISLEVDICETFRPHFEQSLKIQNRDLNSTLF